VSLPLHLIEIEAHSVYKYIRYAADKLLGELGQAPLFDAKNPVRLPGPTFYTAN